MATLEPTPSRLARILAVPGALRTRGAVVADILAVQATGVGMLAVYAGVWSVEHGGGPWAELCAGAALLLGISVVWAWRVSAPFAALRAGVAAGTPVLELDPVLVRAALGVHRVAHRASLAGWLVALGLAVGLAWARGWREWDLLAHLVCPGLAVAAGVPLALRYLLLVWRGIGVTLYLVPDGRLDRLAPLLPERAWFHIGALFLTFGAAFPLLIVGLARSELTTNPLLGLIASGSLVLSGFTGALVLRTLSLPSGHLEGRMQEVSEGNLHTRALILAPDTLGILSSHFNQMLEGLRQREHIRDIFGRYVTRQVAEEILSGRVALGGERRVATVLFADIHGFTRLAEHMPPEEVLTLLNEVLGGMVGCVLDAGGVLDKYIGDAIMALFGVPVSAGSPAADARAAVECAMRMSVVLDEVNARRLAQGLGPVEVGIGVHTGALVAGNIGIPERMEYTVIGDTVNLSSRLEGLTRQLGQRILVSGETAALLEGVPLLELDPVSVRGRVQPVRVYGVRTA